MKENNKIYFCDFHPNIEATFVFGVQIALTSQQIDEYNLPPLPGKSKDPRAASFYLRHGELIQVELDALPPDTLHNLYKKEFENWFDYQSYSDILSLEESNIKKLRQLKKYLS